MLTHSKINYVEFHTTDLSATKRFFSDTFGWAFVDYGPDYSSFSNAGVDGGFFSSTKSASTESGSVLIVIYSEDLENTLKLVERGGGSLAKDIFEFPGGRRFHFIEPGGNELAVWSDK